MAYGESLVGDASSDCIFKDFRSYNSLDRLTILQSGQGPGFRVVNESPHQRMARSQVLREYRYRVTPWAAMTASDPPITRKHATRASEWLSDRR